jgi:hypothetical protein
VIHGIKKSPLERRIVGLIPLLYTAKKMATLRKESGRRVEVGVKEDKNARFPKEPTRCTERKWLDRSLKEKWIQPKLSTVPQPEAEYGTGYS